jgi:hypothetical protein
MSAPTGLLSVLPTDHCGRSARDVEVAQDDREKDRLLPTNDDACGGYGLPPPCSKSDSQEAPAGKEFVNSSIKALSSLSSIVDR